MRKMSNNSDSNAIVKDLRMLVNVLINNRIIFTSIAMAYFGFFLRNVKLPFTFIWYSLSRRLGKGVNRFDGQ